MSLNAEQMKLVEDFTQLALRDHYECLDDWCSCPMSEGGTSNDEVGYDCNCGTNVHNTEVMKAYYKLLHASGMLPNPSDRMLKLMALPEGVEYQD